MATVTRENVGLLNDKLTVKVSKEDYYPSFEKAIKEYSRKASIPGFRKGMVPAGMIKKMYGASIFYDEVVKAVEKEMREYLTSEKPEIFAQPLPLESDLKSLDMNSPSEYDFPFEIGLKPDINLPDLSRADVTFHKVNITADMIDKEIDMLQDRHGKVSEEDTIFSQAVVLKVNFAETDAEGNAVENSIMKDISIPLAHFTPVFREQLMGSGKGDSIQLRLNDAIEEKERAWIVKDLGMDVDDTAAVLKDFRLTITGITLNQKQRLDEEFFNTVFPGKEIKTEDEFRKQIEVDLRAMWDSQSDIQLQDQLYHILLDTPVGFPDEFLKKWLQKGGDKEKSPEEAEAEYPTFKNQLKWTLIRDKIIGENRIGVTQEELTEYMQKDIMRYFGQMNISGGTPPWLESYIERIMKDEKHVANSYDRLMTSKLFDWLRAQVTPVEKEVTPEELSAMQHNHDH